MKYDAVVAGAGTAGCVFAGKLARGGFKVMVVEPASPERLGHDWWDTVETRIFSDIGIDQPAPPEARTPFSFMMNIDGRTLPIVTRMPPDLVNIERRPFAARLVKWAAEGGVEFRFGTRAVEPVFVSGRCTGIVVEGPQGRATVEATVTMDASGVVGALRRKVPAELLEAGGMQAEVEKSSMLHTYREVVRDKSNGGESVVCMDMTDSISWLSREPDGLVDVFAGVIGPEADAGLTARLMLEREGGTGEVVRAGMRWMIPLRRPFEGLVLPGFMLAGDSACMADPSNGSGVTYAVRAAIFAADTASEAIKAGNTDMGALWNYPVRFFFQNAELGFLDALKSFIFSAPRDAVLSFMEAGGISGPAFWRMRNEFKLAGLVGKGGIFLRTKNGAALLGPLAVTLRRGLTAELLLRAYPRRYDKVTFETWKRRVRAK